MSITIELPEPIERELVASWGITPGQLPRRVLELMAVEGFGTGALSHHEVSQLLGLGFSATEAFLKSHHCPPDTTLENLEADRKTLEKVLGGYPAAATRTA